MMNGYVGKCSPDTTLQGKVFSLKEFHYKIMPERSKWLRSKGQEIRMKTKKRTG